MSSWNSSFNRPGLVQDTRAVSSVGLLDLGEEYEEVPQKELFSELLRQLLEWDILLSATGTGTGREKFRFVPSEDEEFSPHLTSKANDEYLQFFHAWQRVDRAFGVQPLRGEPRRLIQGLFTTSASNPGHRGAGREFPGLALTTISSMMLRRWGEFRVYGYDRPTEIVTEPYRTEVHEIYSVARRVLPPFMFPAFCAARFVRLPTFRDWLSMQMDRNTLNNARASIPEVLNSFFATAIDRDPWSLRRGVLSRAPDSEDNFWLCLLTLQLYLSLLPNEINCPTRTYVDVDGRRVNY